MQESQLFVQKMTKKHKTYLEDWTRLQDNFSL